MSLDGIAVRALAQELNERLSGGRVDKISQPSHTMIVLNVRKDKESLPLRASINPQNVSLAITNERYSNPAQPPLFCMVLRKHLTGAIIREVKQVDWERIITITFDGRNEIGDATSYTLLAELMGKSSNIILLNDKNIILDAARRVGVGSNKYRQIQPGLTYVGPPAQNKIPIDELSQKMLTDAIISAADTVPLRKLILSTIAGIGPQTVQNILYAARIDGDASNDYLGEIDYKRLFEAIQDLVQRAEQNNWQPTIVHDEKKPLAFAPFPLYAFSDQSSTMSTMSELLDAYYGTKERMERFEQKKNALHKVLHQEINRCQKKLNLQLDKIYEAESAETYRLYGELLTANLYQIKQGEAATVPNFYEPGTPNITIKMDPAKTPNENAQHYFKKYNKAKAGAEKAAYQAEQTKNELNYLQSIEHSLEQTNTFDDLRDIRRELEDAGYKKRKERVPKGSKEPVAKPLHIIYNNFDIYVGKNNRQNDQLTMKMARGADLWLHTKDIHGAHVIIRHKHNQEFPPEVIEKAAELAAWFSKAKNSAQVPVDMTYKKYVHKPNGARPGMVIYTDQNTVYVTPEELTLAPLIAQAKVTGEDD